MNIDQLYDNQLNFINTHQKISIEERLKYLKKLKNEININEENIYNALVDHCLKLSFLKELNLK